MAMIEASGEDPDRLIGEIPPGYDSATVLKVAVNAVMAGCRPEYLPVVLAAVEAMVEPEFNLLAVQGTTHICTPLAIVNGPIRHTIGMNMGHNCFGEGNRANATIGRAIRLVMLNLGLGIPGIMDKSTFGHPGKYTFCVAENEEASPWQPLNVDRGFARGENTVTMFASEAPHSVSDHHNGSALGIATTIADSIATPGANTPGHYLMAIGPEHASTFRQDGWSKEDLQLWLFEHARVRAKNVLSDRDEDRVGVVHEPAEMMVMVAGGEAGKFSVALPGYGAGSQPVTKRIGAV